MNTQMKYYEDKDTPLIQFKKGRINEIEVYLMEIGIINHKDDHYKNVLNKSIEYWRNNIQYIEGQITKLKLKNNG